MIALAASLSGPASLAATVGRDGTGINTGSAYTVYVCTVIASTVPSLVVMPPRTAGMEIFLSRMCAESVL